jgi:hypothetical protein
MFDPAMFDPAIFDADDGAVTLTFRGGRVSSVDIDVDETGTTVTARIERE